MPRLREIYNPNLAKPQRAEGLEERDIDPETGAVLTPNETKLRKKEMKENR